MVCQKKHLLMLMVVMVLVFVNGAEAQVHHVVGQDRGWEVASDVTSWAAGRTFMVGDFLWFNYPSDLDNGNIVELKGKDEFESCDVSNPIKMYINGVDKISLHEEGIRYFVSSNPETCKKGLKLPVEIKPKSTAMIQSSPSWNAALAQAPIAPSSATNIVGSTFMIIIAAIFVYQIGL